MTQLKNLLNIKNNCVHLITYCVYSTEINLGKKMIRTTLKKTCSVCKTDFECLDSTNCWCFDIPKLSQDQINTNGCMCKNCLMKKYEEKLSQQ